MKHLVILEQQESIIKEASLNVWNTLQALAQDSSDNHAVNGIVLGGADLEPLEKVCRGNGTVFVASSPGLERYSPSAYTALVADIVNEHGIENIFLANTATGKDLAPRLAIRLNAALASDCTLEAGGDGSLKAVTTFFSGTVTAAARNVSARALYMLRSRAHRPPLPAGDSVTVKKIEHCPADPSAWNPVLKNIVYRGKRQDVTESDIIIAGGRGVGSRENFALLESLADALGGVVGASRSAVDMGWRPHADQIGQSGKTVTPRLYIACGISGAPQHLAGISDADMVVAINRDRDAPLFNVADYGMVGNLEDILPRLESAVRALQGTK